MEVLITGPWLRDEENQDEKEGIQGGGTGLDKCISVDDLLQSMLGAIGNRLRR